MHVILKLDDGSRIGNAETLFRKAGRAPQAGEEGVIHMPLTQCADIGLVSDRDFLRLRRLATTMDILLGLRNETELKGFLPWSLHTEAYDLAIANGQIDPETRLDALSKKLVEDSRAAALATAPSLGVATPATRSTPIVAATPAPRPADPSAFTWTAPVDWKDRVNGVLDEIKKALGKNAQWFATKVEEKFAPNYYSVIARPMWFNLVKDNVRKAYVHPQQAYDDLKQIWINCRTYNTTPGNAVVQAADIGERALERAWERKFRATPATAPAKRPASMMDMDYEPGHKTATRAARPPTRSTKKSRSMLSNGSDLLIGGGEEVTNTPLMQMPDFGGYGTAKTAAPTGYGAPSPGPSQLQQPGSASESMPTDLMNQLVDALGSLASDETSPQFQQMLEIIKSGSNVDSNNDSGEVEVDLTELSPETLRKLLDFVKGLGLL